MCPPREFCARVVPALSAREVENGLQHLAARPGTAPNALLLSVEAGGAIVGAAVWTPPHDVVVTWLPEGAAALVAEQCARSGLPLTGASGPDGSGIELAEQLAERAGAAVRLHQRVYELSRVDDVPGAAGSMRRASATDIELVSSWYTGFVQEVRLPHPANPHEWASAMVTAGSAFFVGGWCACSLACLSRETQNGSAIGPVYPPPDARRHGYGTSLVAGLAEQVLASGKTFACLFTDADNPTSNRIYESIGFRFVCRYDAHRLVPQV